MKIERKEGKEERQKGRKKQERKNGKGRQGERERKPGRKEKKTGKKKERKGEREEGKKEEKSKTVSDLAASAGLSYSIFLTIFTCVAIRCNAFQSFSMMFITFSIFPHSFGRFLKCPMITTRRFNDVP